MKKSAQLLVLAIAAGLAMTIGVWIAVLQETPPGELKVSFLDTGAGRVVFIESPTGRRALVDGGAGSGTLRSLDARLPWFDRSLDVALLSLPDAVHAGGMIDVLERDRVAFLIAPAFSSANPVLGSLQEGETAAAKRGTIMIDAKRGEDIDLGGGTLMQILFPDRDLSSAPAKDNCVVWKLSFGSTSFLFSCNVPAIETYLARLDGKALHADVLSENDGSATSSASRLFAGFVGAQFAAQSGEVFVSDGVSVSLQ